MLDHVLNLLEEVGKAYEKSSVARFSVFATDLDSLSASLQSARDLQIEADRAEASRFNFFQWLGVESKEDAHTRTLANLLNPLGSHGQRTVFLERFLLHFPHLFAEAKEVSSGTDFVVTQEENSVYGRTDIRVASRELSLAMIIENKIGAPDQVDQLARYRRHLDNEFKDFRTRLLLYLTPCGRRSRDPSAADVDYISISYNFDIAGWLNSCLTQIRSSAVREFVRHYGKIAANLGRTAMDDAFEKQVVELLKGRIESASIVYRDFPKLVNQLELRFWRNLYTLLQERIAGFPDWFCDFDEARVSKEADVLFVKPLRDKSSLLFCAISLGQGDPDPSVCCDSYIGVQWRGTGTPPWEDPRVSKLADALVKVGLGKSEKSGWWIRYKYLGVELHAPATLKRIADGDQSTEKIIADQAIDLLSKAGVEILEATAAAR
jgi:hypothetical protein